jgi:hypothetical protein
MRAIKENYDPSTCCQPGEEGIVNAVNGILEDMAVKQLEERRSAISDEECGNCIARDELHRVLLAQINQLLEDPQELYLWKSFRS